MFMSHQLFLKFLNERPLLRQVLGVYEICEAACIYYLSV